MSDLIVLEATQFGVAPSHAEQIEAVFVPMVKRLKEFEGDFNQIMDDSVLEIDDALCKRAKRLRLDIKKVRTETENMRKDEKDEYLKAGKAIDGVANILKYAVSEKEKKLADLENYFENKEKERIQKMYQERLAELAPYMHDESHVPDLGTMDADVWIHFRDGMIAAHSARIEAEKKAEADRVAKAQAEADERERLKVEAAESKKVADAARIEADAAKAEAEQVRADAAAEQKIKDDAAAAKQKKLHDEIDAKDKAEQDRKDAEAVEAKRIADDEEATEKKAQAEAAELAKADDQVKLDAFAAHVVELRAHLPTLKDKDLQSKLKIATQELYNMCQE